MKVFTIGFTQKDAEKFFGLIRSNGVLRILDVRLNNVSQLAGFTKRDDLRFFLKEICDADYSHLMELAPTQDILNSYKKKDITWETYEERYTKLISSRKVELLDKGLFNYGCLLCSEHKPNQCHRRLAIEYLNRNWDNVLEVKHLS